MRTDAAGVAVWDLEVPELPVGATHAFQAAAEGAEGTRISNAASVVIRDLGESCRLVGDLMWCYHPSECGQACDATCAAVGMSALEDSGTWLAAQDTVEECEDLSLAFGNPEPPFFADYTYACSEDDTGPHTAEGGLNMSTGFFCSSWSDCPDNHRTTMDVGDRECGVESRRSICPCE
jgi:hypothetical protein